MDVNRHIPCSRCGNLSPLPAGPTEKVGVRRAMWVASTARYFTPDHPLPNPCCRKAATRVDGGSDFVTLHLLDNHRRKWPALTLLPRFTYLPESALLQGLGSRGLPRLPHTFISVDCGARASTLLSEQVSFCKDEGRRCQVCVSIKLGFHENDVLLGKFPNPPGHFTRAIPAFHSGNAYNPLWIIVSVGTT